MARIAVCIVFIPMLVALVGGCSLEQDGGDSPTPSGPNQPPAITVRRGAWDLPDGSGEFIFEEPVLIDGDGGRCTADEVFRVANEGGQNLILAGVELIGDTMDFDLDTTSLADTVEPSYTTLFTVSFDPRESLGVKTAVVKINSNDPQRGNYRFTVRGYGMKRLVPDDCTVKTQKGYAVDIWGDTAVVTAPQYADGVTMNQGAVFVLGKDTGGPNSWGVVKRITVPESLGLAYSAALDADTLVVGAGGHNEAYLFYRDRGGTDNWGQVKKLTAAGSTEFGAYVDIYEDTVTVGDSTDDIGGRENQGSVYVFSRNEGGLDNWGEVTRLTASDPQEFSGFGRSMAVGGDVIVVGSPGADAVDYREGAAYVFHRDHGGANNWGEVRKIRASDGEQGAFFGGSVGVDGETIVVGAHYSKYVYLFDRNQGGHNNWGETTKVTEGHWLGQEVDISGDVVAACGYNGDGVVCLFSRNRGGANQWGLASILTVSVGNALSHSVAIHNRRVITGEPYRSDSCGSYCLYIGD